VIGSLTKPIAADGTSLTAQYDNQGTPNCTVNHGFCPLWDATAFFYATCPGGAGSCPQADSIHVGYQISPTPAPLGKAYGFDPTRPTFGGITLKPYPATLDPNSFISIPIGTQHMSCGPNSVQTGITPGGKPICTCTFGATPTGFDANGFPQCPNTTLVPCAAGQLIQGLKANGQPKCVTPHTQCIDPYTFPSNQYAVCPNAGWLENISLGACSTSGSSKKGGTSNVVSCASNTGRCCWYVP
jgi:hypothetical protein